jgi:hypothetical protein
VDAASFFTPVFLAQHGKKGMLLDSVDVLELPLFAETLSFPAAVKAAPRICGGGLFSR